MAVSTVSDAFSSYGSSSIPQGTFSLGTGSGLGVISGNPVAEAAYKASGKVNTNGSESSERLFYTRPRYASDDRTNRGTHAYIKLITSEEQSGQYMTGSSKRSENSSVLKAALAEMSSGVSDAGYDKFLVTSVSAGMDEKIQIMEVFGDNEVAYYFGRAPMIFTISGTLVDSPDNGWFTNWLEVYAGALRGSQLAKNYEMLKIVLPNMTLIGSMTNFHWTQQADNEVTIPFSFQFLVKSLVPTPVTSLGAISNSASLISFDAESSFTTWSQINDLRHQGASIVGALQNPMSTVGQIGSAMSKFGTGVTASFGLTTGGTSSTISRAIDGLTSAVSGDFGSLRGIFNSITSGLEGIRASIFSPVYGVMNSLTRLVKNVFGGTGLSSIFSALTAPVRNILGDITRIATQAAAIVGMVTSGIAGFGRSLTGGFGISQDYLSAVRAFKRAAGVIAAAPLTVSSNLKGLFNSGYIPTTAPFLQSNPKHSLSRSASLSSSGASLGGGGATLGSGHAKISPQIAILSGRTTKTATAGVTL